LITRRTGDVTVGTVATLGDYFAIGLLFKPKNFALATNWIIISKTTIQAVSMLYDDDLNIFRFWTKVNYSIEATCFKMKAIKKIPIMFLKCTKKTLP